MVAQVDPGDVADDVDGDRDEQDGKEVLYTFLGNVVGQLSNIEQDQRAQLLAQATDYYSHALRINPEYARAQLGVAEAL